MKQYNGKYGCPTCLAPGVQFQRGLRVYPSQEDILRTDRGIRTDAVIAYRTGIITNGIKGCSALAALPEFDLVEGVTVDSLHCAFEGVTEQWFTLLRNNVGEDYYIGQEEKLRRIDESLLLITPPSRISRQPRSISTCNMWKGSECRNWALYYSLPCLVIYGTGDSSLKPCFFYTNTQFP